MSYPIAEKIAAGALTKPHYEKCEFYKGGLFAMQKRLRDCLLPLPGAYDEFLSRTEGLEYYDAVAIMWDYIYLV